MDQINLLDVEIITPRLILEPISSQYQADIFAEFTAEITTYMIPAPPRSPDDTAAFIADSIAKLERGTDLGVVILEKQSRAFLGCAGLHSPHSPHPELGIWLKKSAQGQKYGLEAIQGLKTWAEDHLDCEYFLYPVDRDNWPSRKIPEALGGKVVREYVRPTQRQTQLQAVEYQIPKRDRYKIWQRQDLSQSYLEGVRGAIPLATEQIEIILRVIRATQKQVQTFLDLGCGDGILGRAIARHYPEATGVFLDLSETMLTAAKKKVGDRDAMTFILEDFGRSQWLDSVTPQAPFDIIVSGFSIHHQPDERKQTIYREIYSLLKPGGLFLNLEHVASQSRWSEQAFSSLFVDSLYEFHQRQGSEKSRAEIDREYYSRDDKDANILAPVEVQCRWLQEIGFVDVECFMKVFEIALFGGLRKTNLQKEA